MQPGDLNVAFSRSRVLRDDIFLTKQGLWLLLRPELGHSDGVNTAGKGVMKQTEFMQKDAGANHRQSKLNDGR